MTKNNSMEIQEQEPLQEETERTRECQCFIPRADIYETEENIIIDLDMPGINENAIEITLEKNILDIKGYAHIRQYEGYSLVESEYNAGDFERNFRISESIDRENIQASYNNGVLHLTLLKAETAKVRKIAVRTE
jgi:HSP20 family molecular chaperone IbpA